VDASDIHGDPSRRTGSPLLSLALQGGGAHGAFTWGVLDRLLDEPGIEFGRISGTSAGALNGAALATGLALGGRAEAKKNLARLWRRIAEAGLPMSFLLLPLRKPGLGLWDDAMPLLSPYQTNPLGMSPVRGILSSVVSIDVLQSADAPSLFVNAVNVHTGHERVFGPTDMSIDALLASACAPLMFQAVDIDGESYWDGSYVSNPSLWPLYAESDDADILMVELTPMNRLETPRTAKNILNRINEIASINGLMSELRALDMAIRTSETPGSLRFHVVSLAEAGTALEIEPSVKRTVSLELFESLRSSGHAACESWLASHREKLGVVGSVDVRARYLLDAR
jgi:NTE family protein